MSVIMDVADAVAALLNGGSFSQEFTAVRAYQPVYDLELLKTLRVSVLASGQEIEKGTRSDNDFDFAIDVGVQKKVASPLVKAELDALTDLVEELLDYLLGQALPAEVGVTLVSMANKPIYDPDHLQRKHVFTSVITATYTSYR